MKDRIFDRDDFYNLEIGEYYHKNDHTLLRVPGGWVYGYFDQPNRIYTTSVFIPYVPPNGG